MLGTALAKLMPHICRHNKLVCLSASQRESKHSIRRAPVCHVLRHGAAEGRGRADHCVVARGGKAPERHARRERTAAEVLRICRDGG